MKIFITAESYLTFYETVLLLSNLAYFLAYRVHFCRHWIVSGLLHKEITRGIYTMQSSRVTLDVRSAESSDVSSYYYKLFRFSVLYVASDGPVLFIYVRKIIVHNRIKFMLCDELVLFCTFGSKFLIFLLVTFVEQLIGSFLI